MPRTKKGLTHLAAQFISAAINVGTDGAYEITAWRTYLIFLGVSAFTVLLNIYGYHLLGKWNEGARKSPALSSNIP